MSSFDYIAFDDTSNAKIAAVKEVFTQVENQIMTFGDHREKLYAILNLEQSFMWVRKLIENEQRERHLAFLSTYQPAQILNPVAPPTPPVSSDAAAIAKTNANISDLMQTIESLKGFLNTKG